MVASARPNILLIMADQHAWWASGAYGHPFIRTPNLDRLATRGVTFDAAYCPSPICTPSRAAFLTGRHVHRTGVWDNGAPMPSDLPTWAHHLSAAGYHTALTGKQHFIGPDQSHGFETRMVGEIHSTRIKAGAVSVFRPDFDTRRWLEAGPQHHRYTDYDNDVAASAVRFLSGEGRDAARPFALEVSFIRPHHPLLADPEDWALYWPHHGDLPDIPAGYPETLHPAWQYIRRHYHLDELPLEHIRRIRAAYYALCTFVDRKIGEVVDALERSGLADNTLVMYTSDHGEHAGSHGLIYKQTFFEDSVRVPLITAWPGRLPAARREPAVVSQVDVTATILDAAGVTDTADLDGRSLLPLARGQREGWPDVAFSEFYQQPPVRAMLRAGRYKLNEFVNERPELYDLETDPGEWHNLADDPRHAARMAALSGQLAALWDRDASLRAYEESVRRRQIVFAGERTYLGEMPDPSV